MYKLSESYYKKLKGFIYLSEKRDLIYNSSELADSEIVANAFMNRNRGLAGVNSYSKDLKINIPSIMSVQIEQKKRFFWLDLCCGKGRALVDAANFIKNKLGKFEEKKIQNISIFGIDLIDDFIHIPDELCFLSLKQGVIPDAIPKGSFDLITCVHGLHYLGDKLRVISSISGRLVKDGFFIGNIDHKNLKSENGKTLRGILKIFSTFPHSYSSSTHILKIQSNAGKKIDYKYKYKYLGSSEEEGPNYTRQNVIDSFYKKFPKKVV